MSSVTVLCSTVNRRVCLNAASAQEHGLLSECIKEWKTYPWEAFRVDNSSDCSACRIISPFVWDSKISTLLCSNRMSGQEDLNFGVPLCDDCKRLVNDVRIMIKDNSTAVDIEKQLDELVCNNLPGEIIPYCKNIINAHVPYLLQMLADSLARKRKCHENKMYSWIKRPSTSDNHKWTSYSTQAAPTCPECLNVLNQFKTGIQDSTIQERLKKLLDEKVCAHMGFFSAACREAVEYNFDQILSGVSQVDAKELCSLFGMCSNEEINLLSDETTLSSSTTTTTTSLSTKQNVPGVCQLCEMIVHKVFQLIAANRTEREIMLALELVCDYLPSSYKGQCVNFVDNYGVKVVEAIVEGTGPGLVCTGMGLCNPFTSSAINEHHQQQQQQQEKLPSQLENTQPVSMILYMFQYFFVTFLSSQRSLHFWYVALN
ncbi:unnamed protein product [Trichobilharzia regenti]|nr:unnamed protein product [Trichobilharzia regenti]